MNSTEFIISKQNIETVYSYIQDLAELDRDNQHGERLYRFRD